MDAAYLIASWAVGGFFAGKVISKLKCTIFAYAFFGVLSGKIIGEKILTYFGVSSGGSSPQEPAVFIFNGMAGFTGAIVVIIVLIILKPLFVKKPKIETDQECWQKVKRQTP